MTSTRPQPKPREAVILALAGVTLAAYGCWIYTFGVFLDDLVADLGARESTVVAAFGAAQLIAGTGSVMAGRVLDRRGSAPVFATGIVGTFVLACSALATSALTFFLLFSLGAGVVGATGFYHVSQTVAARIAPGWETHAITRLTLYAAFSAPIYYPLAAWLVDLGGWRLAVSIPAATALAGFIIVLTMASIAPSDRFGSHRLTASGFSGPARRYAAGVVIAAGTIQLLSVYQVPVMVSAGLGLGVASTLAGARGVAQFLGRLPLVRIATRFGAARSLRGSMVLLTAGTALLAAAGTVAMAALAMLAIGLAIGAQSPLVGIRGREVFDEKILGTALGTVTLGSFVAGAAMPVAAGALVDATGSRLAAVALGAVGAAVAVMLVGSGR